MLCRIATGKISAVDDICSEVDRLNDGSDIDKDNAMQILQDQELIVSYFLLAMF